MAAPKTVALTQAQLNQILRAQGGGTGRKSLARAPRAATATSILPESGEVRFLDAAVTAGVAAGSALWTVTRPTTSSQLGWGTFWIGLGALMAVMGRGELRYGGFGVVGANATVFALRLVHPNLATTGEVRVEPVTAGSVRYVRVGYRLIPVAA